MSRCSLVAAFALSLGCADLRTAAADAVRIMPLGDSITQGSRHQDSYRRPLWHQLQAAGYAVDFVGSLRQNHRGGPPNPDFDLDHEGHWGWTVNQVLDRIEAWIKAAQPDAVLLHLGTNDLMRGEDPETIVSELRQLIQLVRRAHPRVAIFIATLIPARGAPVELSHLNARIAGLSAWSTEDSPIYVVDQFRDFDVERQTVDGVHPNPAGEEHMAARWFGALAEWLGRTSPATP